ncbi:MAG TPA: hypothetical protein VEQ58_19315 [Polyangiaceae bacterium]|nr:hypothetical protein [Polyangiaceae bacterium]
MHLALCSCVPAERQPGEHDAPSRSRSESRRPKRAQLSPARIANPQPTVVVVGEPEQLPVLTAPFKDEFERAAIGDDYYATGDAYRIEAGRLCVKSARNHPLWLRHRLPTNARIQVEAEAASSDGDVKLEAWGDGRSAATHLSYTDATSYLAIFGGWKNRYHVLARLNEHALDRTELVIEPGSDDPRQQPVLPHHRYRLKLERTDGHTLRFWADDVELASFSDDEPLSGALHDHFAFNDWETPVCFDHLVVEPLPS